MRSIGKIKIRKLKEIVRQEYESRDLFGEPARGPRLRQSVLDRVPDSWRNTWESAHDEIERIIHDEISALTYSRDPKLEDRAQTSKPEDRAQTPKPEYITKTAFKYGVTRI